MRKEQEQEEEKITSIFFQKVRSYEEGKNKGEDLLIDNIPKLGEKWSRVYKWILVLMGYIDEMVCWELKALRPSNLKAQLFDCGVPGKIQVLQIPETCSEDSNEGGMGPLKRT